MDFRPLFYAQRSTLGAIPGPKNQLYMTHLGEEIYLPPKFYKWYKSRNFRLTVTKLNIHRLDRAHQDLKLCIPQGTLEPFLEIYFKCHVF